MKITTTENGNAARMAVFCRADSPPEYRSAAAIADWMMPHDTLTEFAGFSEP